VGADDVQHPLFLGKLLGLELGVNQIPIEGDFKAPATRGNQLEAADLLLVRRKQLARQTDGLRLVVSHRAIHEFQIHNDPPLLRASNGQANLLS
jgi:hypothetical protein